MKYSILRLMLLFMVLISFSSCFEGRWANYKHRSHYVHRRHYRRFHERRNGDW